MFCFMLLALVSMLVHFSFFADKWGLVAYIDSFMSTRYQNVASFLKDFDGIVEDNIDGSK
jgi:hypothetical protein